MLSRPTLILLAVAACALLLAACSGDKLITEQQVEQAFAQQGLPIGHALTLGEAVGFGPDEDIGLVNVVVFPEEAAARSYGQNSKYSDVTGYDLVRTRNVVALWDRKEVSAENVERIKQAMATLNAK